MSDVPKICVDRAGCPSCCQGFTYGLPFCAVRACPGPVGNPCWPCQPLIMSRLWLYMLPRPLRPQWGSHGNRENCVITCQGRAQATQGTQDVVEGAEEVAKDVLVAGGVQSAQDAPSY